VRIFDAIAAETIAARIFADPSDTMGDDDAFDDAYPDQADRYVARMAFDDTETEAKFVETLNDRRERFAGGEDDDPAMVASLQRLAKTAWIHTCRARAAAAGAEGDAVFSPLAAHAVARARRAERAIASAAALAVTRAAIRARNSARARIWGPARLNHVCRPVSRSSRPRARRVRVSAVASGSAGNDEPSPEPPGPHHRARRALAAAQRLAVAPRDSKARAALSDKPPSHWRVPEDVSRPDTQYAQVGPWRPAEIDVDEALAAPLEAEAELDESIVHRAGSRWSAIRMRDEMLPELEVRR
jgi:hypothetical protein